MSQTLLAELNAYSEADFVTVLANIFEYSPWIAEQAASSRPFAGIGPLFDAMKAAVDRAPSELRLALIKAHPDLANKTQRAAPLTAVFNAEQNSVGLDRLSDAEYEPSSASTTPIARSLAFPTSSASGARPRIPSCAISNAACRTMPRPRCRSQSRRFAGSRPCGSTSWWPPTIGCRCMAACRPMCSIPTAASPRRVLRLS